MFKLCDKMSKAVFDYKKVEELKRLEEEDKANALHIARSLVPFEPASSKSKVSTPSTPAVVSVSSVEDSISSDSSSSTIGRSMELLPKEELINSDHTDSVYKSYSTTKR